MAVSTAFKAFVQELFEPLGTVTVRAMFGGAGIYAPLPDGPVMFGLIADEVIYLKADDGNRGAFEAAGCEPFVYEGKDGRAMAMSYYRLPEDAFDDPDVLKDWARSGLDAALRSGTKARKRKPSTKTAARKPTGKS